MEEKAKRSDYMLAGSSTMIRWVLVIFMAFFLAIMLDNSDRNMRMMAGVFLIVLAQIREITLLSDAGISSSKDRAPAENPELSHLKDKNIFGIDSKDSPLSMEENEREPGI